MKPLLHDVSARQLQAAVHAEGSGYLFHGPRMVGKAVAAREMARQLNCQGDEPTTCRPCRQFAAGTYPDSLILQPEDRPSITIEQVRRLNHALSLRSYSATGVRVVIIDDAHQLTVEAQNALLKILEEPPAGTRFVLVAEQPEALLTTVRSRLAAIYFAPLPQAAISDWLTSEHGVTPSEAVRLARLAAGAPGLALRLVGDAAEAETLASLEAAIDTALAAPLFDRLLLARRLADDKTNLLELARRLQRALIALVQQEPVVPASAGQRLAAVERFRRGLEANLAPRVALERLMLEL